MRRSLSLTALLLFLFSCISYAQSTGTIKGFVYDKKTGEPMIYTYVTVVNGKTGAQTDVNGYFSIALPAGTYTLMSSSIGYDSVTVTVNVVANAITTKKIYLSQHEVGLKEVEVSGHKRDKITRINTGVTTITPRDLKLLPGSGGEPDVAQYLQVVPGVVFTGDQGGQLYIRGGSTAQTGIYLDGVTIYNPFHSIGLYSVFETETIRNVDVYTAGFGAQYGNRTSAIVDVHTKDGNKNEIGGLVSVSPIMSRVLLDGPIVKSKKDNGGGLTFLLSYKNSYLDQTSKSIYGGFGEPFKSGLPYKFSDFYGKVTLSGSNGSKLNLFGFNFDDHATLLNDSDHSNLADYHWRASGGGATFVVSPSNSSALIDGKVAFSNYNISLNQLNLPIDTVPRTSQIGGFEAAINFTYFLHDYSQLKYGVEVAGNHTQLNYYSAQGITSNEARQGTLAGLYVLYRHNFNSNFIFEPSIRLQYYSELQKLSPEPRLGLKYNVSSTVRLKAAAGVYSQDIVSTKPDQDVVNLFTGFLLAPDQVIKNADGSAVKSNLQTAYHGVAGVEVDLGRVEMNLEPWVKYFGEIAELNRFKTPANNGDFTAATGLANGVDLSAKYSHDRKYLWVALGYQNVNYTSIDNTGAKQTYPAPFDARFNGNVVASYTAGAKKDWDLSARFNIRSPFPFTQTQGFYENVSMTSLGSNYLQQNGGLNVIYATDINGGRLSWYHRLDLSVKKRFAVTRKSTFDITLAVTNVYDRNNVFYVNRISNVVVYQLPIFPSLNLTFNF